MQVTNLSVGFTLDNYTHPPDTDLTFGWSPVYPIRPVELIIDQLNFVDGPENVTWAEALYGNKLINMVYLLLVNMSYN